MVTLQTASSPRLHVSYDPLCGWCYAAAPLLQAAHAWLPLSLHGGGMWSGTGRRQVSKAFREQVMAHDRQIAALSGQPFGTAYHDGLLNNQQAWLDSSPPIAAIEAAQTLAGAGLAMLIRLQQAHYIEGQQIAQTRTLQALAEEIGLNAQAFSTALSQALAQVDSHIADSRRLLNKHGGQGFPTILLERDGQFEKIDCSHFLGNLPAWQRWLTSMGK
jgi:putative protein-disulfide isomerase